MLIRLLILLPVSKHDMVYKAQTSILFFVERNLHLPFLEPVHDYFKQHHPEIITGFSAPPFRQSIKGKPGRGVDGETKKRLSQKSVFIENPAQFNPDVCLIADINAVYYLRGCEKIVNVGHSLNSKGRHYTNRPIVLRENLADLVCVPGPFHYDVLKKNLVVPVVTTGYIKSDVLFRSSGAFREKLCQFYNIDPAHKLVLFAPTFDPQLSAIPVVRERIVEVAGSGIHLVIKLHGMTDHEWVSTYKSLAEKNACCTFVSDNDISPWLQAADLLISDVSSAFLEFMLLNKPVILVDNPLKEHFAHYDSSDIEYSAREACETVKSCVELKQAVHEALNHSDKKIEQRKKITDMLCYGRDGKSAERTAKAVLRHLHQKFPLKLSVIVPWGNPPCSSELLCFLSHLKQSTRKFDIEIIMCGSSQKLEAPEIQALKWIECREPNAETLHQAVCAADNEFVAVLFPEVRLPDSWPKFLMSHIHRHKETGLVQAIQCDQDYERIVSTYFSEYKNAPLSEISYLFNLFLIGSGLKTEHISSPCIMFTKEKYHKNCPSQPGNHQTIYEFLSLLGKTMRLRSLAIIKALDVFAYTVAGKQ